VARVVTLAVGPGLLAPELGTPAQPTTTAANADNAISE
jgi:hypothetical protein